MHVKLMVDKTVDDNRGEEASSVSIMCVRGTVCSVTAASDGYWVENGKNSQ